MSQKTARVEAKKNENGSANAIAAIHMPIINCMSNVHFRFVPNMSTNGLQKGLITHGKYRKPV